MQNEILLYIAKNYTGDKEVDLLPFFMARYPDEKEANYRIVISALDELIRNDQIRVVGKDYMKLGFSGPLSENLSFRKLREKVLAEDNTEYYGIFATIKTEGIQRVEDIKKASKKVPFYKTAEFTRFVYILLSALILWLAKEGYSKLIETKDKPHVEQLPTKSKKSN